jgi:AraC-like DNA-binding protein
LEEPDTVWEHPRAMDAPRGILRPAAVGRVFDLDRAGPPPDLAAVVEHHWRVAWDLRGRPAYRSEVLTHPSVHLVFEPHGAFVYGVRRRVDVRILAGTGWAVGTKFRPGGFGGFLAGDVSDLTDSVLPFGAVFGADGAALAEAAAAEEEPAAKVALLQAFLRERLVAPGPETRMVQAVVAAMREAPPGTRVEEIAAAHGVSVRTLERRFRRHVGVGPKWVLQRYRLHEALEQIDAAGDPDWSRFALDLGYYDQAHFLRDFRAVAGRSPARYAAEARALRPAAA